ncbi:hypothetical protein BDV3_006341 [Batrachochytrium dendrobatidis]
MAKEISPVPRPLSILLQSSATNTTLSHKTGSIRDLRKFRVCSEIPASVITEKMLTASRGSKSLNAPTYNMSCCESPLRSSTSTPAFVGSSLLKSNIQFPESEQQNNTFVNSSINSSLSLRSTIFCSSESSGSSSVIEAEATKDDIKQIQPNDDYDMVDGYNDDHSSDHTVSCIDNDQISIQSSAVSSVLPASFTLQPISTQIPTRFKLAKGYCRHRHYAESLSECKFILLYAYQLSTFRERLSTVQAVVFILRKLGQQDLDAQYILASTYEYGVPDTINSQTDPLFAPNPTLAFTAYLSAAKRGHIEAMFKISEMYHTGIGTRISRGKAIHYLRTAAIKHHPQAMTQLGLVLIHGKYGHPQRIRDGVVWLRMACRFATVQYPDALYLFAELHINGLTDVIFKDDRYVVELLERGAKLEHAPCVFKLAEAYQNAWFGLDCDMKKSFYGYCRAANMGHLEAMLEMSRWYLVGAKMDLDGFVLEQSNEKAYQWILKSAKAGHARAMFGIGHFYSEGLGVVKNTDTALEWYRKAAKLGEPGAIDKLKEFHLDVASFDPIKKQRGRSFAYARSQTSTQGESQKNRWSTSYRFSLPMLEMTCPKNLEADSIISESIHSFDSSIVAPLSDELDGNAYTLSPPVSFKLMPASTSDTVHTINIVPGQSDVCELELTQPHDLLVMSLDDSLNEDDSQISAAINASLVVAETASEITALPCVLSSVSCTAHVDKILAAKSEKVSSANPAVPVQAQKDSVADSTIAPVATSKRRHTLKSSKHREHSDRCCSIQ